MKNSKREREIVVCTLFAAFFPRLFFVIPHTVTTTWNEKWKIYLWRMLLCFLLSFDSIQLISRLGFFPHCCFALYVSSVLWFISVQLTLLLFFSIFFCFLFHNSFIHSLCVQNRARAAVGSFNSVFFLSTDGRLEKGRKMAKAKTSESKNRRRGRN